MGRRALLELLDEEHAAAWMEAEARIADVRWRSLPLTIDPQHLSTAKTQLVREGLITEGPATATRGGREIHLLESTAPRRQTARDKAAARKRLLLARYLGWAQGREGRTSVTGPAAERVVHDSLIAAGQFILERPGGGDVNQLLGCQLAGPLDSAAHTFAVTPTGIPGGVVTLPIEVKNIRDWVYPVSDELYQLLDKAAALQRDRPESKIVPTLVCRRAHKTAFYMAKALGFFISDTNRQYILNVEDVTPHALEEVRAELGFVDLAYADGADDYVVNRFAKSLRRALDERAEQWAYTVAVDRAPEFFAAMRYDSDLISRAERLDEFREVAEEAGLAGGW